MLENIVPATEKITSDIRSDETGRRIENNLKKELNEEQPLKNMPNVNDTKRNRLLLQQIMYTNKEDYKNKGNQHDYQRIQKHWNNNLVRQCAYFDKTYSMEDMSNPENINLASIAFSIDIEGQLSEGMMGERVPASELEAGTVTGSGVDHPKKEWFPKDPEYLAPPDLSMPNLFCENIYLVLNITQLVHEHDNNLIGHLPYNMIEARNLGYAMHLKMR